MIGLGIGVAWAYKKINRYIANLILSFRLRVLAAGGVFEAESCLENQLSSLQGIGLLNDASLLVTPNAYKAGILYDIVPNTALGDLNVVRATSATRVDANGLVEIPRTNLVTYSEEFGNINWNKILLTITPNTTTSPDGTTSADTLNIGVDASPARHRLVSNTTTTQTIGTTYTGTFYLKKASQRWVQIIGNIGYSSGVWANFDIENGVIGNTGGVDTTATIENVGNGWYRCRVSGVATATSTTGFELLAINNTNGGRYPSYQSLVEESVCFVWGAQTEVGSTATEYIPTTTSIRTKFAGITQDGSSASNIPRLDYSNGSCPSILVEPQRTNLALRSQEFDNAAWSKINATVTANTIVSPDGTQNADKFVENNGTGTKWIYNVPTVISGSAYTYSIFAKKGERDFIYINGYSNGNFRAWFNLNTGTIGATDAGVSAKIENYGNGWYKCSVTFTAAIGVQFYLLGVSNANNVENYTGDGTSGIYIWGAQNELGSNATSYIPTTSASVTRNADIISKTGISSLIGQTEGTIYFEADIQKHNQSEFYIAISNGSSLGEAIYFQQPSSGALNILFRTSGLTPTIIISSANWNVGYNKIAIAYNSTLGEVFINGVSKGTVALSALPTCSQLTLGARPDNPGNLVGSGGYKIASLFKTRLTNTELAQLTTL
jgi:hypothetical protein